MRPFIQKSYLIILLSAVTILAIIVTGLYFFQFHNGLAKNPAHWANFGDYIGGTLGPIFAFMAFVMGLLTLDQMQKQSRRDELLKCIQGYEKDFEVSISKPVTCQSPWIFGNNFESADSVKEVPLRTLLQCDGIYWEQYLPSLQNSLEFRVLSDGSLIQDRDVWLSAFSAIEGIFRYIYLYRDAGGDEHLVSY